MTLSTTTAAFTITPVVIATFLRHVHRKLRKRNIRDKDDTEAVDDILFEEAFHIVKAFLELATRNTLDELQAFTNTYVPPPFWAECVTCTVPLACCNKAADILLDWFDPEELKTIVGGERWWQVRGLEGVQAEWIAMKRDWDTLKKTEKRARRSKKGSGKIHSEFTERLDKLKKVVFYVHGGGFYFGSINTHRYQIIRLARKLGGRAFAVNYRKSPQYPWPCPIQDVLAAYLYLIRPPPGAPHTAINPKRLVIAGDSAGANLCLSLLVILRDMKLPMPAGAVVVSPWVDLTHSFPSVIQNTATDIIPPHGFIHKPSTLWPIPTSGPHAVPIPKTDGIAKDKGESVAIPSQESRKPSDSPGATLVGNSGSASGSEDQPGPNILKQTDGPHKDDQNIAPQKVQVQVDGKTLEIRSQFQLYATNIQVTHPLVSPLLNSSLGGLCPLYILAGDKEVLRDEIVYLSHRAAEPTRFPLRSGLMTSKRQKENAEIYKQGTQVHFQLFDDMCHVLTVFSFTNSANYAYRGIARFAKRVMEESGEELASDPFPATQLGSPLQHAAIPVSEVPSGVDAKQNPSTAKGDHVGRERSAGTKLNDHDIVAQESPEGKTRPTGSLSILCERVDIHGVVRPLECDEEIVALGLSPEVIGVIKDAPVNRWLEGQRTADLQWANRTKKVERDREAVVASATKFIKKKTAQGAFPLPKHVAESQMIPNNLSGLKNDEDVDNAVAYYADATRRWTPFDLDDESPPPAAISGRRDTPDAIALLKSAFEAPLPPARPNTKDKTTLSPSEQQRVSNKIPSSHGVRLWSALMSNFMNTNVKRDAANSGAPADSDSDRSN